MYPTSRFRNVIVKMLHVTTRDFGVLFLFLSIWAQVLGPSQRVDNLLSAKSTGNSHPIPVAVPAELALSKFPKC